MNSSRNYRNFFLKVLKQNQIQNINHNLSLSYSKASAFRILREFKEFSCSNSVSQMGNQIKRNFYPYKKKINPLKVNSVSSSHIRGIPDYTIKFQLISQDKVLLTLTKKKLDMDFDIVVSNEIRNLYKLSDYDHRLSLNDTKKNYASRTIAYVVNFDSYDALLKELVNKAKNLPITGSESITVRFDPIPEFVVNTIKMYPTIQYEDMEKHVNWDKIPSKIKESMLPFQKESIFFASQRNGRLLLADEMGLGKTIQAIAIMSYYRDEWPLLIITPGSLRIQWKNEFIRWLDLKEEEILIIEKEKDIEYIQGQNIFIISYDLLARNTYKELLTKMKFKCLICDESHFLKTGNSMRTKAARGLIQQATRAILLTGTAAPSRPVELYEQIKALVQYRVKNKLAQKFMTKSEFGERYCDRKDQFFGVDYRGSDNLEELNTFLSHTLMVRRLKKDVLKQLPGKNRKLIFLLNEGEKLEEKSQSEIEKMDFNSAGTISYYYETSLLKQKPVRAYIRNAISENERFLCFAHHKSMMNAIEEELKHLGVKYVRIDGDTTHKTRQKRASDFCSDMSYQVALLSITVAGTGLTFLPCSKIIFSELYWTPGTLLQAEDRVHRIGQSSKENLDIRYLVSPKTLDDYVWPLISSKLKIISHIMDHTSDIVTDKFETVSSRETVYFEEIMPENSKKYYEEII